MSSSDFDGWNWPTITSAAPRPFTKDELKLYKISGAIRTRPEWWTKVNNIETVKVWVEDAKKGGPKRKLPSQKVQGPITTSQFEWLAAQLRWLAFTRELRNHVEVSSVPHVHFDNDPVEPYTKGHLKAFTQKLIDAQLSDKDPTEPDWDDTVTCKTLLNVVNPALYPIVFGRSQYDPEASGEDVFRRLWNDPRVAQKDDKPTTFDMLYIPRRETRILDEKFASSTVPKWGVWLRDRTPDNFQWLPSMVRVEKSGEAFIKSYVNSLHPYWHDEIYPTLEWMFSLFLASFEAALTGWQQEGPAGSTSFQAKLPKSYKDFWTLLKEPTEEGHESAASGGTPKPAATATTATAAAPPAAKKRFKPIKVAPFLPPPPVTLTLLERDLKFMTKIVSIELTPRQSSFDGEPWRVGGGPREAIVATGIYFFDTTNVYTPKMEFRMAIDAEFDKAHIATYGKGKWDQLDPLYGIRNGHPATQELGALDVPEDTMITFPNALQYRLSPFRIKDKRKGGHVRMLIFYLVQPNWTAITSADVPPQQLEWVLDEVRRQKGTRLARMPAVVLDLIFKFCRHLAERQRGVPDLTGRTWSMSRKEALENYVQYTEQRKAQAMHLNRRLFERPFRFSDS